MLYKRNTGNISKIHLGQGGGENYTVTLVVAVKDFYKAATRVELSVQVKTVSYKSVRQMMFSPEHSMTVAEQGSVLETLHS